MSHAAMESAIIRLPCQDEAEYFGENPAYQFAYAELKGRRPTQEDALIWQPLDFSESSLSPQDIAYRLWTTYLILDESLSKFSYAKHQGSTACTTVYDGNGHLIVANLADSVSFFVVYDRDGFPLAVKRLNSVLHKPEDADERRRIEALGGFIADERVSGLLAMSRAFGDYSFSFLESSKRQHKMISAAAKIDIVSIEDLLAGVEPDMFGKIHIISTCDGFTESAFSDLASVQEQYLLDKLKKIAAIKAPANFNLMRLAKGLANLAYVDGSHDNITVGIQVLERKQAFMLGIYDGHGGHQVSNYIGKHLLNELHQQLSKQYFFYAKQDLSVYQLPAFFNADNHKFAPASFLDRMHPLIKEEFFKDGLSETHQTLLTLSPVDILSHFSQRDLMSVDEKDLLLIHYNHPQLNIRVYTHLFHMLEFGMAQLLQFGVMINRLDIVQYALDAIPPSQCVTEKIFHDFLQQTLVLPANYPVNIEYLFEMSLKYAYLTICEYLVEQLPPDRGQVLIDRHQKKLNDYGVELSIGFGLTRTT